VQWDPKKAQENERKHSVRFSDVEPIFYDPYALTLNDDSSKLEERFVTIGKDGFDRVLVVVYTYRGDEIRLISARPATRREVKDYEEGI
jgi:uncharacterized DUF497 family protein